MMSETKKRVAEAHKLCAALDRRLDRLMMGDEHEAQFWRVFNAKDRAVKRWMRRIAADLGLRVAPGGMRSTR